MRFFGKTRYLCTNIYQTRYLSALDNKSFF